MTLDIYPPVDREGGLVDRDEPLAEVAPTTTQPAAEAQPPQVVAGLVLERLRHLVREQPAFLHGPVEKLFNNSVHKVTTRHPRQT